MARTASSRSSSGSLKNALTIAGARIGQPVRLSCPECNDAGPHDVNGDREEPTALCCNCGFSFDVLLLCTCHHCGETAKDGSRFCSSHEPLPPMMGEEPEAIEHVAKLQKEADQKAGKIPSPAAALLLLAQASLRPFSRSDWNAFAGCESKAPMIGEAGGWLIILDGETLHLQCCDESENDGLDLSFSLRCSNQTAEDRATAEMSADGLEIERTN